MEPQWVHVDIIASPTLDNAKIIVKAIAYPLNANQSGNVLNIQHRPAQAKAFL